MSRRWLTTVLLVLVLIVLTIAHPSWMPPAAPVFLLPFAFLPVMWGREPN